MTSQTIGFLFLSSALMAIPPPHLFINVRKASMVDARTLEVSFEHPRCDDPAALGTEIYLLSSAQEGARRDFRLGLLELREEDGLATCKGPVTLQTLKIDLRKLVARITPQVNQGVVHLNEESLYGYMKKLPTLKVEFDFQPSLDGGRGKRR